MSYCEQILQSLFFGEIIENWKIYLKVDECMDYLRNTKKKLLSRILEEFKAEEIQRGKSSLSEPVEENVK